MGKQPGASPEELEFIFQGFLRNLPDREILDEMEDKEFPKRNPRFIRERRKHFDAAKKVLQIEIQKELDPIIVQRKKEHFERLAEMTNSLIPNKTDRVEENPKREDQYDIFEYTLWQAGAGQGITREQLSSMLQSAIELSEIQYGEWDMALLASHLESEFPDVKTKGVSGIAKDNPYELIQTLWILARRKTFRGTCPVCRVWLG